MGCFLGCFGVSKRKKQPRKTYTKVLVKDIIRGSYEHLDSTVPLIHETAEDDNCLETEHREKPRIELGSKIRKRVTFNLNVQVFEPVLTDYRLLESEDDGGGENEGGITEMENDVLLCPPSSAGHNYRYQNCSDGYDEDDEIGHNYRYQNCSDGYDEDDETAYGDCDFEDEVVEEEEYHDVEDCFNCVNESLEDFSEQFRSVSLESPKEFPVGELDIAVEYSGSVVTEPHCQSKSAEPKTLVLNDNARDRSRYVHSVLNPIENLTQWKAVKRDIAAVPKPARKENCAVDKEHDLEFNPRSTCNPSMNQSNTPKMKFVAVDASLSNWLA